MSFSCSFISFDDRKESRLPVDIRSLSTLDRSLAPRWKNVVRLLVPRSGLALPERESTLPPEPPSRVFSNAGANGRRPFSLGLRLGEPFRFSGNSVVADLLPISLIWSDLIWFDLVWFSLIRFGLIWFDLIWFDSVWFGLVWFDSVWFGLKLFAEVVEIFGPFANVWSRSFAIVSKWVCSILKMFEWVWIGIISKRSRINICVLKFVQHQAMYFSNGNNFKRCVLSRNVRYNVDKSKLYVTIGKRSEKFHLWIWRNNIYIYVCV